jgi:hypothetical protein
VKYVEEVRVVVKVSKVWLFADGIETSAQVMVRIIRTVDQIPFGITGPDQPATISN